jgi:Fe-S-cluster-containing dehydrogenase component
MVACKVSNRVEERFSRCRVTERLRGAFPTLQLTLYSERCNHCAKAPCTTNP